MLVLEVGSACRNHRGMRRESLIDNASESGLDGYFDCSASGSVLHGMDAAVIASAGVPTDFMPSIGSRPQRMQAPGIGIPRAPSTDAATTRDLMVSVPGRVAGPRNKP